MEYLDFYKQAPEGKQSINYLVFDSKFTNYENLTRLDDQGIKYITSTENQIKVELKKKRDLSRIIEMMKNSLNYL